MCSTSHFAYGVLDACYCKLTIPVVQSDESMLSKRDLTLGILYEERSSGCITGEVMITNHIP